ncbi:hypothetical protein VB779_07690 [Haloarculaceae archaeon H-GB11]|nr:hypothetical protein [Haloarculaceae archaeon H-GB11]
MPRPPSDRARLGPARSATYHSACESGPRRRDWNPTISSYPSVDINTG